MIVPVTLGYYPRKFGSDPELFLRTKLRNYLIPAERRVSYKKRNLDGGSITAHADGIAYEFQVPPKGCRQEMCRDFKFVLNNVLKLDQIDLTPTIDLTQEKRPLDISELDPRALEFGCNPSFNVYDNEMEYPCLPEDFHLRFIGGHIHTSFNHSLTEKDYLTITENLDLLVGLWLTCITPHPEEEAERRKFYGGAGSIRKPSETRIEYRTPSSVWLYHPIITHLTFGLVKAASQISNSLLSELKVSQTELQHIINKCQKPLAYELLSTLLNSTIDLVSQNSAWMCYYENRLKVYKYKFISILAEPHSLPAVLEFLTKKGLSSRPFTANIRQNWSRGFAVSSDRWTNDNREYF